MWTLRNEPRFLASQYKGNAANEYNLLMSVLGVSAGFTDHTCECTCRSAVASVDIAEGIHWVPTAAQLFSHGTPYGGYFSCFPKQ